MRGHIHTDIIAAGFTLAVVVVGLHAMRTLGTWLAAHGATKPGQVIGGLATFN